MHRFDGRTIHVDKAAGKPGPRNDGGYHGRGGYNTRGGYNDASGRGGYNDASGAGDYYRGEASSYRPNYGMSACSVLGLVVALITDIWIGNDSGYNGMTSFQSQEGNKARFDLLD